MSRLSLRASAIALSCALMGAALNVGFGALNHLLGLPLYFDSIFTMSVTAAFGLLPGMVTAIATNTALAIGREVLLPFALCNIATALIAAVMRRKRKLGDVTGYLWLGLWAGLANAILGSLISAFVFGGVSQVHRIDDLVSGFVVAGQSLVSSVFLAGLLTNLVDKVLSALAAFAIGRWLTPLIRKFRNQPTSPSSLA